MEATDAVGTLDAVTRPLLETVRAATGLDSVFLTQVAWEVGEQHILFALNTGSIKVEEGDRLPWSDTLCRRAMLGGPMRTNDALDEYSDSEAAKGLGLKTYVTVPVVQADHTIWGTLCGASGSAVQVDDAALEQVKQAAARISERVARDRDPDSDDRVVARERARMEAVDGTLRESTTTDALTGLHNRRGFEERWHVELERCRRFQYPVAVLLLDLEGARAAGDAVVRQVSTVLEKQVRDIDLLARLGGDEFVIGLSHADALVAEHVFDRVRAQVEALDVAPGLDPPRIIGGLAASSTTPITDLSDAAMLALEKAREAGGGQCRTWHGVLPD